MDDVQRCHEVLLQQRTQIRHHQAVHLWMKRCWQAAVHADPLALTQDEYEDMYSILMYEMTICWEEELNDAILLKIWKRDAASHATLNFERFCCSMFYFVEMWVEEITLAEYEKIFCHVYRILSGHELHSTLQQPPPSLGSPPRGASPDYKPRTFKPTLESFNNALDNEKAMEELQMNFGKSISFNAQQYYRHFGTPTTHLQAFQATLLHLQSRVHIERGESGAATTSLEWETTKSAVRPTTSTTAESTARMLRRQLKEAMKKPAANTSSGALDTRPPSPLRSDAASSLSRQSPSSPPKLMRPVSSACRASFVLDCDVGATGGNARVPSPECHRPSGDAFVMAGKSVLHSPQPHAR